MTGMDCYDFTFGAQRLLALASGALWWPARRLLCVSDLHLGKSLRIARRGGTLLPPYEVADTLALLDAVIEARDPAHVICLGDSFDDLEAADLPDRDRLWLTRLMAGRRWTWVEGNHDPGPLGLGGEHRAIVGLDGLTFRHIADPGAVGAEDIRAFPPQGAGCGPVAPLFPAGRHKADPARLRHLYRRSRLHRPGVGRPDGT